MNPFVRNVTNARGRASWSRSIERLLSEVDSRSPVLRSMRPIYRRDVAGACAPALTEIRWVLDDRSAHVRPEAIRRLRDFLTYGTGSPLFGDDPCVASRGAREIAAAFVVPAAMRRVVPSVAVQDEQRELAHHARV